MNLIKKILLDDWKAKLACVLLATALWYLIRQNVPGTQLGFDRRPLPSLKTEKNR